MALRASSSHVARHLFHTEEPSDSFVVTTDRTPVCLRRRTLIAAIGMLVAAWTGAASAAEEKRARRVLFLGSSTTAGAGASRDANQWTSRVSAALGWVELNAGLGESTMTADSGARVPSAQHRWRSELKRWQPEIVVVQYGANDVKWRVPVGAADVPGTFWHAAAEVIGGIAAEVGPDALVVVSPQPNRLGVGVRSAYDEALRSEAERVGARFISGADAFDPAELGELSTDALHLNDAGHSRFARFVLEELQQPR